MARSEIQEKVEMVACADFILQKRYMSTPPRKVDVYDENEFLNGGEGDREDGEEEEDEADGEGTFRIISMSKRTDSTVRKSTDRANDKSAGT